MINKNSLLKDINFPSDLRKLQEKDLQKVEDGEIKVGQNWSDTH